MKRVIRTTALFVSIFAFAACGDGQSGVGPDPIVPQYYSLAMLDNQSLPFLLWRDGFGGTNQLQSATLIPYAVGRTIDRRLLNDRTGRGQSGGNARDTTVARGQMMDIRILRMVSSSGDVNLYRDSAMVDVEVKDTVVIVSRPHPDPSRVRVDTGYFQNDRLILATVLDYRAMGASATRPTLLNYNITR